MRPVPWARTRRWADARGFARAGRFESLASARRFLAAFGGLRTHLRVHRRLLAGRRAARAGLKTT